MLVLGLVAAMTLGSVPAEVGAASDAIELRWAAPEGCPEAEQARVLVGRLVPSTDARVRAVVIIDAVAGGFVGTLELHAKGSPTARRLEAEDCLVLARAMAVVIAVGLDPVAVAHGGDAASVPEPEASVPEPEAAVPEPLEIDGVGDVGPSRASASEPSPRAVPRGGLEGGVRIGAGVGGLLLPAAGVGLSLAPFIGTARVHVRAVAQYWAPQTVAFDPLRDAGGELQLVTGGVRVCPQLAWGHVRVPLCAGADAGTIFGRGIGRDLTAPRSSRGPWVGAVLEPGVTVDVTSRVSLWLALEGVVSLYRPVFAVDGAQQAWTAGAGALRGLLGVQVHARRDRQQNR